MVSKFGCSATGKIERDRERARTLPARCGAFGVTRMSATDLFALAKPSPCLLVPPDFPACAACSVSMGSPFVASILFQVCPPTLMLA